MTFMVGGKSYEVEVQDPTTGRGKWIMATEVNGVEVESSGYSFKVTSSKLVKAIERAAKAKS